MPGFYEDLINNLTSKFQNVAGENNLPARYDNDPRPTPTEEPRCEFNIDLGTTEQCELGIDTTRVVGNFTVKIKSKIGIGISELFEKADIIAAAFRNKNLNGIIFQVPRIENKGRIGNNWQVNVICPFFADKR